MALECICNRNYATIASDNGLSAVQHPAITWTNAGLQLIGPKQTNFSKAIFRTQQYSL